MPGQVTKKKLGHVEEKDLNFPLTIIPRTKWGAVPATSEEYLDLPVYKLLVSHTQTEPCHTELDCIRLVKKMQRDHMRQGHPDIRYNFIVGSDGNVYEGRGWKVKPSKHPSFPRLDRFAIEISHAGKIGVQSTMEELMPRLSLIRFGQKNGYITEDADYMFDAY